MLLTLKQLSNCQDAIARVGALPINPEQAAIAYRMSKNVEKLTGSDVRDFYREKTKLLRSFGTESSETPGFYNLIGAGKEKYEAALDKLEAETVDLRIRQVDYLEYLKSIGPNGKITPVDINALEFIFIFPADFLDDDEKPAKEPTEKSEKAKS